MVDFIDDIEEEPEKDQDKEPVDPAVLEKATDLLKSTVRGNGIRTDIVALDSFEGEVLPFEARSTFLIEHSLKERHVNGRENGEAVGSESGLRAAIQQYIDKIAHNREVKKHAVAVLKKREDLGFAVPGLVLPLEKLKKTYVVHEACNICETRRTIACTYCKGSGETLCQNCNGTREMICNVCQGRQYIPSGAGGGQMQCTRCNGRGRIGCDFCQQSGQTRCRNCSGTGKSNCQNCNGTGWRSLIASLEFKATSRFEYQKDVLPEDVVALIDKLGPQLVKDKHAEAKINEDIGKEKELEQQAKAHEFIILYDVRLPYGDITFHLKTTPVAGKLFGFQPFLTDMPYILEKSLYKGFNALDNACRGSGNPATYIKEAIRYRALGETFLAVLRFPLKRATDLLHEKYPFGLKRETIQHMVSQADKSVKRITKWPRLIGTICGYALTAALAGLYYFGPLYQHIVAHINSSAAEFLVDLGFVIIGGLATTTIIQALSAKTLIDTLGKLVPPKKRRTLLPKSSKYALTAYGGSFVIVLVILEAAIAMKLYNPAWHSGLLKILGL